jgi:hypothetical protein
LEIGADKLWKIVSLWRSGEKGQVVNWLHEVIPDPAARAQAVKELDTLAPIVPGEAPTSGLAAVSGDQPIPVLKAIEERARRSPAVSQQFAIADQASEAARIRPLERIAAVGQKPVASMGERVGQSPAEAVRSKVTKPLYAAAEKELVPVDETLRTLLGGDLVQPALARANAVVDQNITNALAAGKTPTITGITGGKITPGYDLPEWAMMPRTPDIVEPAKISIGALQAFKKALDKDIATASRATDADGLAKLAELQKARTQLNSWMRDNSQAYAKADDTFRLLSQPQNQAQVADVLRMALGAPGSGERGNVFLNAMRNAPTTLNKSDLPLNVSQISQVMSPNQMGQINRIASSLQREDAYSKLRTPTLPAIRGAADELSDLIPSIISRVVAFGKKGLETQGREVDTLAERLLAESALDPKKLARLIEDLPPQQKSRVIQWMRANSNVATGAQTGLLSGGLFVDEEKRGLLD